MGYSIGRWDGDTLVVESNGYNDKTWVHNEGLPHTERLRITERYRRSDFGHVQIDVTYDDPGAFNAPLHAAVRLELPQGAPPSAKTGGRSRDLGDQSLR